MLLQLVIAVYLIIGFLVIVRLYRRRLVITLGRDDRSEEVLLSTSQLEQHARDVATRHRLGDSSIKGRLPDLNETDYTLRTVYHDVSKAVDRKDNIVPAAEWFFDNYYIVQAAAKDIRHSLPMGYYRNLPKLAGGPQRGYPRAYAIAQEIVAHTDGRIDEEVIAVFLRGYQSVSLLSIGEVWALPALLKLALVEEISDLSLEILHTFRNQRKADQWACTLLEALKDTPENLVYRLQKLLPHLKRKEPVFLVELLYRFRNQGGAAVDIMCWLERFLADEGLDAEELVHLEHQRQSARKVAMGNRISSLRLLASLDWSEHFERLNYTERILREDPSGVYPAMDFASRDLYRHHVERLAKALGVSEVQVARQAVSFAKEGSDERTTHVGYYLLDQGKDRLLKELGAKPRPRSGITRYPVIPYLGVLGIGTILISLLIASFVGTGWKFLLAFFLLTIPVSDLVVTTVNSLITRFTKPQIIPKMEFRNGIPKEAKTVVVVPTLLPDRKRVTELFEQLEVYYLANAEDNLYFALLGDFTDRKEEHSADDEEIIQAGRSEVRRLNQLYGKEDQARFFFFCRKLVYNPKETCWMGWERKRGKLEEFNALLSGVEDTSFIGALPPELTGIKYVITLDADTNLVRDTARRLIGAMAHPLNQPVIDDKRNVVVAGYGVLQPRIGISVLSAASTRFARTFAGQTGIDPYTTAVSDVYQDLFKEGSFTGKGIYSLETFNQVLGGRFPENGVLSHDLLEGSFVRAGLVSDVELLDGYPTHYPAYSTRLHRWVRGDWQLLPYLGTRIRDSRGEWAQNPLGILAKWKIFDNLRRSLLPVSTLVLLTTALTVFPASAWLLLTILGLVILYPVFSHLVNAFLSLRRGIHFAGHLWTASFDAPSLVRQGLLLITFLPHQAWLMLDAIVRTLFRLTVTKRNLLEWVSAFDAERRRGLTVRGYLARMWPSPMLSIAIGTLVYGTNPALLVATSPLLVLWLMAPVVAYWVSLPVAPRQTQVVAEEREYLRVQARRIWQYFKDFVGPGDHWLPPDHIQEEPHFKIAHRTSPTNIGLGIIANLAAWDFGYIGMLEMLDRLEASFASMLRLKRWHGHLYNWYDTETLKPLEPRFVSTVDSGNLAGYLITLVQGLDHAYEVPLVDWGKVGRALWDTYLVIASTEELSPFRSDIRQLCDTLQDPSTLPWQGLRILEKLQGLTQAMIDVAPEPNRFWVKQMETMIETHTDELNRCLPWVNEVLELGLQPDHELTQTLLMSTSLAGLEEHEEKLTKLLEQEPQWQSLKESFQISLARGAEIQAQLGDLISAATQTVFNMDFAKLYNDRRNLFSIGYNLEENRLSRVHYDLMASEARQASFIAIAKGDIEQKHWFRLGRMVTRAGGSRALVSWTGTMFEYLMPLLIMRNYRHTLWDDTYEAVVREQMRHGDRHDIPWGVSECAFNAMDLHLNYQYRAFGVPQLGFKRGLANDLIVTPYASFLALMVDPAAAVANLKRLGELGLEGKYGLYEAVDFTKERLPRERDRVIVKSFMVHHLGMSFLALANYFLGGIMQERFHLDPYVKATEMLLQERIPLQQPLINKEPTTRWTVQRRRPVGIALNRRFGKADLEGLEVHLASNGDYAVMVTNSGSGYSKWREYSVTRFREDPIANDRGMFIYIRNLNDDTVWSVAYQPTRVLPDEYEVSFAEDKAEFRRLDASIETKTEITVCSENDGEMRRVSITNHGSEPCVLEVTSFFEVVLDHPKADAVHPTFGNLFVQTEYIPEVSALIASRRSRGQEGPPLWVMHTVAVDGQVVGELEYETDRGKFIGRGQTTKDPMGVHGGKLGGTVGAVLDPCMSLRRRVRIAPGQTSSIVFSLAITSSRQAAIDLASTYHDPSIAERALALAWTRSQVELRYLNVSLDEAHLFQRLASQLLFAEPRCFQFREEALVTARSIKKALWSQGISGDHPILLLKVRQLDDAELVRQVLVAHEYWRMKGLPVDLVILNEHEVEYANILQDNLKQLIQSCHAQGKENRPGGVYLRQANLLEAEELAALVSGARLVLSGPAGLKACQLRMEMGLALKPSRLQPSRASFKYDYRIDPTPIIRQLKFFNGYGGFTQDGKEYVVVLNQGQSTPAPWINVIANDHFGFLATETGGGYTWAQNSRENRLTPWTNDPVSVLHGEAIFLRDNETGQIWSPTPAPIRGENPYVIRHGFGYTRYEYADQGIHHVVDLFAAAADPVKIIRIRLQNKSDRRRSLGVTYYAEPVLGVLQEENYQYISTGFDRIAGGVIMTNAAREHYADHVAFLATLSDEFSFTGDRLEFLGRNGSLQAPVGLNQVHLSGRVGTAINPCAAIMVPVTLEQGAWVEVTFLLGECTNLQEVQDLVGKYRQNYAIQGELDRVRSKWDELTGRIRVSTPEPSLDYLVNGWLLYQVISCRYWGRSAFYQSGGAYGYRDQLQDVLSLIYTSPHITREHILRAAAHQFQEGDVQHWWHPEESKGIRTRFSDDYLWLPYVTAKYVLVTGDTSLLDEEVPFLSGRPLEELEQERYDVPEQSEETGTIYEHCQRAINYGLKFGVHGLPLIGAGDWNDGMNRIGWQGRGESVWLGWFLCRVLEDFARVCVLKDDEELAAQFKEHIERIATAIEQYAWDGQWYLRAFFDDGTPLGSSENDECKIDAIAQAWAVISGVGDKNRAKIAMRAVDDYLVSEEDQIIRLLTPPFYHTRLEPGYIKSYVPGVRENGGQYTHAAAWVILAKLLLGDRERAMELLLMLSPVNHALTLEQAGQYRVEPYVVAADIYSVYPNVGRGGWTWYTGAASWFYQVIVEYALGLKIQGQRMFIRPCIPADWPGFSLQYRYGSTIYDVTVDNQNGLTAPIIFDDLPIAEEGIPLTDDGKNHKININAKVLEEQSALLGQWLD
ncbi:MAG: glycosyl transferase family 36 [Limnochordia bacterium]|nr:glycosyl transferase family 36 [Limnochordia bacterium]